MSRARSELWQRRSREPYAAWARPCLASVLPLPSWSPKAHCYLKRSVRKDFSFPDHWQMFAQIYFGGISSTLLSFLPKELEEHFKNTFISLSFYPSVAPGTLPLLLSFCPSFFLDLLGCDMDFICRGTGKGCWDRGGVVSLCCKAAPQHSWCPFTSQPTAVATAAETSVHQVSTIDLCPMQSLC